MTKSFGLGRGKIFPPSCAGALDESCNAALLVLVLGEVPDQDRCIAEVARVVLRGGSVKFAESRRDSDFIPFAKLMVYSLVIASAAFPATTQLADPATTASSSNQRNPKSSMHSGKSGLMVT